MQLDRRVFLTAPVRRAPRALRPEPDSLLAGGRGRNSYGVNLGWGTAAGGRTPRSTRSRSRRSPCRTTQRSAFASIPSSSTSVSRAGRRRRLRGGRRELLRGGRGRRRRGDVERHHRERDRRRGGISSSTAWARRRYSYPGWDASIVLPSSATTYSLVVLRSMGCPGGMSAEVEGFIDVDGSGDRDSTANRGTRIRVGNLDGCGGSASADLLFRPMIVDAGAAVGAADVGLTPAFVWRTTPRPTSTPPAPRSRCLT